MMKNLFTFWNHSCIYPATLRDWVWLVSLFLIWSISAGVVYVALCAYVHFLQQFS